MHSFPLKKKDYFSILLLILIPVIIYCYFLIIKTKVIYGDDLYLFTDHARLNNFSDKINQSLSSGKYRPVHDFMLNLIIQLFQKQIGAYYVFNVGIQIINTFLFVAILNLFIKPFYLSLLISLLIGLSRFAFFNVTQLLNGGALEGLAISFFFLFLFFVLKTLIRPNLSASQKQKMLAWSIAFANLSMYTHERYIVLFPVLILMVLFASSCKTLTIKQQMVICFFAIASMVLNFCIKKYIYSIPFFVGTGGSNISLSFSSAATFFKEAILSIVELNTGPTYLVGIRFSVLPWYYKIQVLLLVSCFLLLLGWYVYKILKKKFDNETETFMFLGLLFFACLVPAVVTIRLEQRWLQASFSIFVLLIAIAASKIKFKNNFNKDFFLSIFIVFFLLTDGMYLYLGNKYSYMKYGEKKVSYFKQAIDQGILKATSTTLFILQDKVDINNANVLNWQLGSGAFFDYYLGKTKKIIFIDSINEKLHAPNSTVLTDFNRKTNQLIIADSTIIDVTNNYFNDSVEYANSTTFLNKNKGRKNTLVIDINNFNKFSITGLYAYENGINWTNGKVYIGFRTPYVIKDSLFFKLNTFMVASCKNVIPKVVLKDGDNNLYQPILFKREKDSFYFTFYFKSTVYVKQIIILSALINSFPDKRNLSFPLISLEVEN